MADGLLAVMSRGMARPMAQKSVIGVSEGGFLSRWGWNSGESWSGKSVTVDSALQLSTVWACVRLIAETISTLPIGFFERMEDGSRKSASGHPLYELLHNQPNADQTAVVFWEVVVASMLLWGNAYVEIVRAGNRIIALQFLAPDRMQVDRRSDGSKRYRYTDQPGGKWREIAEASVMHLPAFSVDGLVGLSPVSMARNVFGTAIAGEQAAAETFRDASRASGIVTVDALLKPDQREQVRAHVAKVSGEGGVYVLEKGMGFESLRFSPQDAELLTSRAFAVEEMCRWFRVPPFMVGHSEKSTSWGTGIEQQMLGFETFVLRPWCVRIEQGVRKDLLTPAERARYFAEFNMAGLQRADSAGRAALYSAYGQNGILTRNEMRALENRPPMDGGNDLTVQSNLLPISMLGKQPAQTPAPNDVDALKSALQALEMKAQADDRYAELRALVKAGANQQPSVVNVTTHMPAVGAPVINVEAKDAHPPVVNVQVNPTPVDVSVTNDVQPTPVEVHAAFEATVQPAEVKLELPARKTDTVFERNANGDITRASQVERDA